MSMAEVFAPVEAKNKDIIMQDTWGHLAPKKNKSYKGTIVWAQGCYGNSLTALSVEFKDLDDSPWLYEAIHEFMFNQDAEVGNVYRFTGAFRNYKFIGKVQRIDIG